jgi:hypothetical protein
MIVNPAIVIYPGSFAVAARNAVTSPQIVAVPLLLRVTELGTVILPVRSSEAFKQRFAHKSIRGCPVIVIPAAIGNVCPPMVIEPSALAVAAT